MTLYRCHFVHMGVRMEVASEDGIAEFREGFWVNSDLQFTKGMDSCHWIPPHKIEYIEADRSAVSEGSSHD